MLAALKCLYHWIDIWDIYMYTLTVNSDLDPQDWFYNIVILLEQEGKCLCFGSGSYGSADPDLNLDPGRPKLSQKKEKMKKILCLKSSLLVWRVSQSLNVLCRRKNIWRFGIKNVIKNLCLDPDSAIARIRIRTQQNFWIRIWIQWIWIRNTDFRKLRNSDWHTNLFDVIVPLKRKTPVELIFNNLVKSIKILVIFLFIFFPAIWL